MRKTFAVILPVVVVSAMALVPADGAASGEREPALAPGASSLAAAPAVTWVRTWGGWGEDAVHRVAVDRSGNVYVAGEFSGTVDFDPGAGVDNHDSNGSKDAFLAKYAADGTFQWARSWGGPGRDVAVGLAVDSAGNAYVVGPFQSTVDFDPDPVLTALRTSNGGTMNNMYLSKFTPGGSLAWVRTWGPSDGGGEAYSVAVDGADNVLVVGDFSGTSTNFNPWDPLHPDWHENHPPATGTIRLFDAFLSKFDPAGDLVWARTWGGEGYDDGPGVTADALGNVYVAGMYASQTINFDPAGGPAGLGHPAQESGIVVDVFVSKFDADGKFLWVRTWGGTGADDVAGNVALDGLGGVYVSGRYGSQECDFNPGGIPDLHSAHGSSDAFLVKYDTAGTYQWGRSWGESGLDAAGAVACNGRGTVYVVGNTVGAATFDPGRTDALTPQGAEDAFVAAFDVHGNLRWTAVLGGSGDDFGHALAVDGAGGLYAAGSFSGAGHLDPGKPGDVRNSEGAGDAFLVRFGSDPDGQGFYPVVPCRLLDTRNAIPAADAGAPILAANEERALDASVLTRCGIPADARALSLNVTAVNAATPGSLSLFPSGLPWPGTESVQFQVNKTRAAFVLFGPSYLGGMTVKNLSAGTVHVVVDVTGYFR